MVSENVAIQRIGRLDRFGRTGCLRFDAYKNAVDVLKPADIALCTTRPYIRPVHVEYAAAHTNQRVTWDQITNSCFQFCDYLDNLNYDSPPPVKANEDGYFLAPEAGIWSEL